MKLDIIWTNRFSKEHKTAVQRGLYISLLEDVTGQLASPQRLPVKTVTIRYLK